MPTYEYECKSCGNHFDVFQKITDQPGAKCPKCKAQAKRLISSGLGIIFKGSGFYATDYRKKPAETKETKRESKDSACKTTGCTSCPKNKDL